MMLFVYGFLTAWVVFGAALILIDSFTQAMIIDDWAMIVLCLPLVIPVFTLKPLIMAYRRIRRWIRKRHS